MSSIYDFLNTEASNSTTGGVNAAEGMDPSAVNDAMRAWKQIQAGWLDDIGGVVTVGGTADAHTVTLAEGMSALATGMVFGWKAPGTNAGAATAALTNNAASSLGTKKIRRKGDTALSAGDMLSGGFYLFRYDAAYDSSAGALVLLNPESAGTTFATGAEVLAATSTTAAVNPAGLAPLIQNINNNAFKIADLEGVRLNMAGGIADAYDSETDVDTATSTNESYDSTNDMYSPSATAATAVPGATGTIIGNLLSAGAATPFDGTTSEADGATDYTTNTGADGALIGKDWGSGNTKTIYGFRVYGSNNSGLWAVSASNTIKLQGSTDNFSSSNVTLYSATFSDANGLVADVTSGITTTTAYRYHRVAISGNGAETVYVAEIVFYDSPATINNMTLVSNAFTASAVPTQARVAVFIDPQVSITINTDFTAEVSRDGGTTWTAVTLAIVSNPVGTVEQYEGSVSISSQPSGTSMKYRLKTLNNKDIDVTGIVFQWA